MRETGPEGHYAVNH